MAGRHGWVGAAGMPAECRDPAAPLFSQYAEQDRPIVLQGYTDASGVASDVFDQAIQMQTGEDPTLSDAMQERGIRLVTAVDTTLFYTSFNMLDDVVGYLDANGEFDERKGKLRRAISIAFDYNEFLDIFANGRGIQAQGPIPPGIFGYRDGQEGTNPFVDAWDPQRERAVGDRETDELLKAVQYCSPWRLN